MYSIYHFFKSLIQRKELFKTIEKLEEFPFAKEILSCRNYGIFPDMAIKINKESKIFTGGELIELKDSKSYTVSSFNSTIPSRKKEISKIITSENSIIKQQMQEAGDDIYSMPVRDVYYLIRGRKKDNTKVCLVYGSFFETISIDKLISSSFLEVLEERLKESKLQLTSETKEVLHSIFSQQENFSKVRNIDKASVKLRFRIMTEVKAEGNILNSKKYPEIEDNTLNLVLSCQDVIEEKNNYKKINEVFTKAESKKIKIFKIKHHFNGNFLVLQTVI